MPDLRHAEPFSENFERLHALYVAGFRARLSATEKAWAGGWFRLWRGGPGVSWTKAPPLFSERNGYRTPFLRLFGWRVFRLRSGEGWR